MNPTRLTLFILLLLPLILGAEQRLATLLHEEAGWEAVETQDGGLIIEEKRIPGISVRAVKVEQVLDIQPEILAQVIEDVANYNRFLTSATGLECDLLSQDSTQLIGFQYVDIPLISDRIYGFRITLRRAKELIAAFGLGFAARYAFHQLSKLGGVPGWVLGASIAAATTAAMGVAALNWFAYGERPTRQALSQAVTAIAGYLRDRLRGEGRKKPAKRKLRERISSALQDLPRTLLPRRAGEAEPSGQDSTAPAETQERE